MKTRILNHLYLLSLLLFFSPLRNDAVEMMPQWVEQDFQFKVEGTEDERKSVCTTLDLVAKGMNAKFKSQLEKYGMLGAYMQWIVRLSRCGLNDSKKYLSYDAHPLAFTAKDFNIDALANTVQKCQMFPIVAQLALKYDDRSKDSVVRAVPGIDFPGSDYEDSGSTPYNVRIRLQAPKFRRRFKIQVTAFPLLNQEYEFAWVPLRGLSDMPNCFWRMTSKNSACADLRTFDMARTDDIIAVFARTKSGLWGPPSFIHIASDPKSKRTYLNDEIDRIDYGGFKDDYIIGAKGRIIGFVRTKYGSFEKEKYLNASEMILEEYSDENPKLTASVEYYEDGGKLQFKVVDKKKHYRCDDVKKRVCNW